MYFIFIILIDFDLVSKLIFTLFFFYSCKLLGFYGTGVSQNLGALQVACLCDCLED